MSHAHLPTLVLSLALLASCGDTSDAPGDMPPPGDADAQAEVTDWEDADAEGPEDIVTPPEVRASDVVDAGAEDTAAPDSEDDVALGEEVTETGDGGTPDAMVSDTNEPFVCDEDAACLGRVEVTNCMRAACVAGHCVALPDAAAEGTGCEDGDPCTTGSVCQEGLCSAGVPVDCSAEADPPCTFGVCDTALGGCIAVSADEGTPCDDGDPCTQGDLCSEGACLGISECDDGDACNGFEGCDSEGECTAGTPLSCTSDNPCLGVPDCDPVFGCVLGAPPDCGAYMCADDGCLTSCESHTHCVAGTYCEAGACVAALPDGSGCSTDPMCASGHCGGAVCCAAGQCCIADTECPLADVGVVGSQETYTPQSGFARAVITSTTSGLQTFVAQASGVLERIDLMLQTPAQEGYLLEVSLWMNPPPDEEGAQVLTQTTLLVVAPTGEPTVWTAVFETPITLEAGQTYGVSASWLQGDPDCSAPCAVIWAGAEDDPYPDGVVYRSYDSGGDWELSDWNDDLWFRVWAGQHACVDNMCQGGATEP